MNNDQCQYCQYIVMLKQELNNSPQITVFI